MILFLRQSTSANTNDLNTSVRRAPHSTFLHCHGVLSMFPLEVTVTVCYRERARCNHKILA